MKRHLILIAGLLLVGNAVAQQALRPPMAPGPEHMRVGIHVNYDQSKVGDWKSTLPDPLVMLDGTRVTTPRQWVEQRRPEILHLFETYQYGKWPTEKPPLRYTVKQDEGFGGTAIRKQVTLYFSPKDDGPRVDVLIYLPKGAKGPSPLLIGINGSPNNLVVDDPGVMVGRNFNPATLAYEPAVATAGPRRRPAMNEQIKAFLDAGFGFATLRSSDIEPDNALGVNSGVRSLYLKGEEGPLYPAPDEWGSISAWAWGVSQVIDYLEKDPDVDAARLAMTGSSRLGKTTLWTAAKDQRIKVVLASCSGEGGAALSRRNYGENIAMMSHPARYWYQFAVNWAQFGPDPSTSPVDAHMLISLIAPRPLLLQTGTTDYWSDPVGEFEAAIEAGPVYRLLGKDDMGTTTLPEPDQPIYHTLGYFMHEGGHGTIPLDWKIYLEYMKRYL